MKTMKKCMVLFMAIMMVYGLAACTGGDQRKEQSTELPSQTETSGKTNETEADAVSESAEGISDFSKRLTISYACTGKEFDPEDAYHKYFSDKFNIDMEFIPQSWGEANQQITTWMNAGDLPTFITWGFSTSELSNAIEQELLKKWPDDWKEKYPNLAKAYALSSANTYYEEKFGGTYVYCVPVFANNYPAEEITDHLQLYIRRDFAKAANFDLSPYEESKVMTMSQLGELLKAEKESGVIEYPLNANQAHLYVQMVADYTYTQNLLYQKKDGTFAWSPAEEETGLRNALRTVNDWYHKGYIYPDFYSTGSAGSATDDMFSADKTAVTIYTGTIPIVQQLADKMANDLKKDFQEETLVVMLTDDNGVSHQEPQANYWRGNCISPEATDEEVDRVLALMDYLTTEEGQRISLMGIQGEDWDYDENGNLISLLPEHTSPADKYGSVAPYSALAICNDDFGFINPNNQKWAVDLVTEMYLLRDKVTDIREKPYNYFLASYTSDALTQASITPDDEYVRLIIQDGDFDENYDAWLSEKMRLFQPVLDDLNSGK